MSKRVDEGENSSPNPNDALVSTFDASQEPPKLANGPITRNMAKRIQARLNLWAQKEVTRRIQEQASMLMEEELKESIKFINLLEVIMENGVGEVKFEIHTRSL